VLRADSQLWNLTPITLRSWQSEGGAWGGDGNVAAVERAARTFKLPDIMEIGFVVISVLKEKESK
jgi:hypothetical protein